MIKQTSASVGYICNECGLPIVQKVNFFSGKDEIIKISCGCKMSEMTLKVKNDAKIRLTIPCILCGSKHIYTLSLNSIFSREIFHLTCSLLNVNIAIIGSKPDVSKQMYEICNEINDIFMMYLENNGDGDSDLDDDDFDGDDTFPFSPDWQDKNFFDDPQDESVRYTNTDKDGNRIDESVDFDSAYLSPQDGVYKMYRNKEKVASDANADAIRFKNPEYYERVLFFVSNLVKNKKVYCNCEHPDNISVILEPDRIKLCCPDCGCERYMKTSSTFDVEYACELESLYLDD